MAVTFVSWGPPLRKGAPAGMYVSHQDVGLVWVGPLHDDSHSPSPPVPACQDALERIKESGRCRRARREVPSQGSQSSIIAGGDKAGPQSPEKRQNCLGRGGCSTSSPATGLLRSGPTSCFSVVMLVAPYEGALGTYTPIPCLTALSQACGP
jgi:hypothetical protein